jgi:hypothetical protein
VPGQYTAAMRSPLPLLAVAAAFVFVACPTKVGPANGTCDTDRDCAAGQTCQEGLCVEGGGAGCTIDTECNVNVGEVCNQTTHQCEPGSTSGGCGNTSECPITQFCNTSTGLCADLAPGFCRNASQCTSPDLPVCSAANENVPGRCVECTSPADCGGAACVNPGVCSDIACPANATPINGTCHCNPGFRDNGAGGCVANPTGEGEGEGGIGEGEGEGGPAPQCDPSLAGLDCSLSGGPYNNCTDAGQCECNGFILLFTCAFAGGNPNQATCGCDGGGEGEGEGEGEGGTGLGPETNVACIDDTDCDPGASCLSDGRQGEDGVCKELCGTSADCHNGVACREDALGPGEGFCANAKSRGQACEGSFRGGTWRTTDNFCMDDPNNAGTDAFLLCVSGTCQAVCDGESNPNGQFDCPVQTTCREPAATFSDEFGENVALCQ